MKVRRHHLRPGHADVTGQIHVGAHDPRVQRTLDSGIEMHHLTTGVHRSIGTPCAQNADRGTTGDLGQGSFQMTLDRRNIRALALEPTITCALVFEAQGDSEKPAAAISAPLQVLRQTSINQTIL